jgi:hypothetical protein
LTRSSKFGISARGEWLPSAALRRLKPPRGAQGGDAEAAQRDKSRLRHLYVDRQLEPTVPAALDGCEATQGVVQALNAQEVIRCALRPFRLRLALSHGRARDLPTLRSLTA